MDQHVILGGKIEAGPVRDLAQPDSIEADLEQAQEPPEIIRISHRPDGRRLGRTHRILERHAHAPASPRSAI